jgi:multidrug efflux pump subunit AcrB
MIRFFTAHPTAANLLMAGFLVAGLFNWPTLQRETFPRIEPSQVEVQVVYPGARAEDIEEAVCRRIEDAIDGINDVEEIACEAKEGLARAVVEMVEGAVLDRFAADVKTEVEAIDDFPDQAEAPIIRQLGRTDFVASLAVTGPQDRSDLKALAEEVKTGLLRWGGIPKVDVVGFSDHQIRIALMEDRLRQFGVSASDVAAVVQRQSLDLPSGRLETREREWLLRFADERKRVDEFRDLVVRASGGGGQVRLGDIAEITDTFDLSEDRILFNGKPAAILEISKTTREDTLDTIAAVRGFVAAAQTRYPSGVALTITNDRSSIVRDRLNLLMKNGAQGLFLVFVTLWLFFGLRYSFWVAMGLPVSFLGAVVLMVAVGYSINMLTMVGLLIVIGLLMDDAIVIAENISAQRDAGKPPLAAAAEGARQVLPSIFASFATTACVFGSLAFLEGDIGQILRVVPVVMLFVLAVSLIEAFLILPNHLGHALAKGAGRPGRVQLWVGAQLERLRESVIGPLAELAVAWRYLTLGLALFLLLLAMAAMAGGLLKFAAFPELEGDTLEARILLPQGSPLNLTEEVVAKVEDALERVNAALSPEQPPAADGSPRNLVTNLAVRYNKNQDAYESGAHVATVTADLLPSEERTVSVDRILRDWRRETGALTDVIAVKFTEATVGPAGLAIDIRLKGEDLAALKAASRELQAWLTGYRGAFNITDDLRPGKPEVRLRLKDGSNALGVDARMIADQLRAAYFGTTVDEIQRGVESYEIDVRLSPEDRDSLGDLDYFTIAKPDGSLVPLGAVADLEIDRGYARINRVDGLRTLTIQGDVDVSLANANEIIADTQARFLPGLLERHPGVSFSLEGENREAQTTQKSMVKGFVFGLIAVYLLLAFLFRNYVEPLVVMAIIPFAFVGAVAGHLALGLDFTMPSMLGFVALAGVVVNDSILLVNFIKHYHGDTDSVPLAAVQASRARFRAILLTSVTTIVGLLPMLTETSLQAQILVPLVTSLSFGLFASTLLVLFLVPAVYSILDDFGLAKID